MFLFPAWITFSILTGITSNVFNFLIRYVLRGQDDATTFGWLIAVSRFVVFSIIAVLFDWRLTLRIESFFILFLIGITECIALYLYMKMHVYNELSISAVLSRTRMLWTPVFAYLIIGEILKTSDYIGIAFLFIGVAIVSSPKKLFIDKGGIYANSAAVVIALNVVLFKLAQPFTSTSVALAAHSLPSVILMPIIMKNARKRIKLNLKMNTNLKLWTIILNLFAMYFFLEAIRAGEASKVNALMQSMMIFSVLSGIIFLKERTNITKKLIGAAITLIGVLFLTLYK